jgi:putative DNA primase/helicase
LAGFGPALVKQQIEKAIARYRQSGEKEEQDTPQSSTSTKARIDEDQRTYERLAKLTPGEYDRVRKEEANRLGIQLRTLDKEVAKRCDNEGGGAAPGQGRSIEAFELEPWAGPVSGEAILTALCQTFKRFTIMPDGSYETVALWVIHTYAHEAAYVSPILGITSPQKRCGKTTLQTLLAALVNRPLPTSNISPAAVFRCIEAWCPTLLIDEGDSFLRDNEELRGVINSGHTRATAFVVRTEEIAGKREPVKFSTWAPKAIALIGGLPSTIHDRAIGVPMRRKLPTESVEKLRQDKLDFEPLRRKIKRWSQDNVELLKIYDPAMPSGLNDRAADNWRPLLAIADLVGGDWSKLAREAIKHLATGDDDHEEERIKLLADIRDIFIERQTDRIASADLVDDLGRMEDRPWPEWKNGKPITQNQLARLLKPFKIKPSVQRIGTKTPSCYELASFKDAFSRYLPTFSTSTPQQPSNSAEFGDFQSSTSAPDVEVQNSSKPAPDLHCWGVEVQNPPLGEKEESETVYSDVEVRNPNNDDSEEF